MKSAEKSPWHELEVLKENPTQTGIFTDIDGTISEIAETPDKAIVDSESQELLCQLSQKFKVCGIVTGRSIADARRMVGLDEILYVGNQGLERWYAGDYTLGVDAAKYRGILAEVKREVPAFNGLIEDKGVILAFHYREHPELQNVIEETICPIAKRYDLSLFHGNKVWEMRPNTIHNKGTALTEVVQEQNLRKVLYSGDDYSDYTAFRAVHTLGGLNVVVSHPESPRDLQREADIIVRSVSEMKRIFRYLLA